MVCLIDFDKENWYKNGVILAQKVSEILVYPKHACQVGCQNLGSRFAALQLFVLFVLRWTSFDGNSPVFRNRRRNECHHVNFQKI